MPQGGVPRHQEAYPAALNKEEVAARAAYEVSGGGFNNALSLLRTLDLVQSRGEPRASDNFVQARGGLRDLAKTMERVKRISTS